LRRLHGGLRLLEHRERHADRGFGRRLGRLGLVDSRSVRNSFLFRGGKVCVRFLHHSLRVVKFLRGNGVLRPQFLVALKIRLRPRVGGFRRVVSAFDWSAVASAVVTFTAIKSSAASAVL